MTFKNNTSKVTSVNLRVFSIIFLFSLWSNIGWAQDPLSIDAGTDRVYCSAVGTNFLDATATGGYPPYQYAWNIIPNPIIPYPAFPGMHFHCADLLNDTTVPNPQIIDLLETEGGINFVITITDSMGQSNSDTVNILLVQWNISLGNKIINTFPGDTQTISPTPFGGGYPPYTFNWGTQPELLGNQFDYNVYSLDPMPYRQVVIPNTISATPIFYSINVSDSAGCNYVLPSFQGFIIHPNSVDMFEETKVTVFPNPVKDIATFDSGSKPFHQASIKLTNLMGQTVLHIEEISGNQFSMPLYDLKRGVYLYQIERQNSEIIFGKIIKQ